MQDAESVKEAQGELSSAMGILRVLVFFHVQKVGGTNPRTALCGYLLGFGSLQTRGHGRRSRFQDSSLASKKERPIYHSVCLLFEETWAFAAPLMGF